MSEQTDDLARLREPFEPEKINQIPKGGVLLDYVGHAHITARLLEVDPLWNWAPVSLEDDGRPRFDRNEQGNPVGLWINLTICGLTRAGYGTVIPGKGEAIKELIGDAIRNAAMRFGCGLELWMKDHNSNDGTPKTPGGASSVSNAAKLNSLPPSVICDFCGYLYEGGATKRIRTFPSKYDGKNITKGDPVYKCEECGKYSAVKAAAPVLVEEPGDDLPF